MSGNVIDLFARQRGAETPHPDESMSEAEIVEEFMDTYMGEFLAEVTALDEAATIEELETQIIRIKRLVSMWPRMPRR